MCIVTRVRLVMGLRRKDKVADRSQSQVEGQPGKGCHDNVFKIPVVAESNVDSFEVVKFGSMTWCQAVSGTFSDESVIEGMQECTVARGNERRFMFRES